MTPIEEARLKMIPVWIAIDDPYHGRIRVTRGVETFYFDVDWIPVAVVAWCQHLSRHGRKPDERERR